MEINDGKYNFVQRILNATKYFGLATEATDPILQAEYWDLVIMIDLNNQYLIAFYKSGMAYFQLRNYEKAVEMFNVAIKIDPSNYNALNNRGIAKRISADYGLCVGWQCERGTQLHGG